MSFHIAQINIGRLLHDVADPRQAGFMDNLERINALAEQSPGFVWRLKDDSGNATAIRVYDDPRIALNMSVWRSIEDLQAFAYRTEHVQFFRKRAEWFENFGAPYLGLWWVPVGHLSTAEEGRARLEHLSAHGSAPYCFTFKDRFPALQ